MRYSCSAVGGAFTVIRRLTSSIAVVGLLTAALMIVAGRANAQETAKPDDDRPLPPKEVHLQTNDGLQLVATYYPSKAKKKAVPIIMLHGWKGSRGDFDDLALAMQLRGYAVIVPDLRGHGKSTQIKRGSDYITIDQSTLRKGDIEAMVTQDIEAVKS